MDEFFLLSFLLVYFLGSVIDDIIRIFEGKVYYVKD